MPLHSYTKRMLSQLLLIGSICEKCSENQNVTKKLQTVKAIVSLVLVRILKLVGLVPVHLQCHVQHISEQDHVF